eukprot:8256656-Pyramimonas_sp.AAC.1
MPVVSMCFAYSVGATCAHAPLSNNGSSSKPPIDIIAVWLIMNIQLESAIPENANLSRLRLRWRL